MKKVFLIGQLCAGLVMVGFALFTVVKMEIDEYVDRRVERATNRLQKEIRFKDDEIAVRDDEIRELHWELANRVALTP